MTTSHLQFQSHSEAQTMALAAALARQLQSGDVLALEGELGAGKTCFVRGLAQGLGLNPASVSSPTFVIVQEYSPRHDSKREPSLTLIHIDAYRLNGPDDLETIGFSELLEQPNAILAIEWPSRIASALPRRRINVEFAHTGAHERLVRITAPPEIENRLRNLTMSQTQDRNEPGAVTCRTCGRTIDQSTSTYPFCSPRCRMADLGRWFAGQYRTSRPMQADEELED